MTKRPGPGSRLSRADILRAAYRHFELEETQAQIASELGISTGYLARRLKQARADGWVRFYTDIPAEDQRAAALSQRFPLLSAVEVVGGLSPTDDGNISAMSQVIAGWLNDLLAVPPGDDGHVGSVATGGGTVHMRMLDRILPRHAPCDVGPTSVTALAGPLPRWPASTIAAVLSFRLDARSAESQSGTLFDLSIEPMSGTAAQMASWWTRTLNRPGYQRLFEFWDDCDVVFLGATSLESIYPETADLLGAIGSSIPELRERGAVGIAAGQFFDREGHAVGIVDGVPGCAPAIPLDVVAGKASARRAGDAARAVILDVRGKQAEAARHLVEAGVVTHVVADIEAAHVLLEEHARNPSK